MSLDDCYYFIPVNIISKRLNDLKNLYFFILLHIFIISRTTINSVCGHSKDSRWCALNFRLCHQRNISGWKSIDSPVSKLELQ